jgi:tetratricopeptide (TPR) repeat protein
MISTRIAGLACFILFNYSVLESAAQTTPVQTIPAANTSTEPDDVDEPAFTPLDASKAKPTSPPLTQPIDLLHSIKIPSNGPENPAAKAEELIKQQAWNEAILYLDRAIVKSPKLANLWADRGMSYFNLGQYKRSLDDLNTAILLNGQLGQAYYYRGKSYEKLGSQKLANKDLEKASALGYKPAKI